MVRIRPDILQNAEAHRKCQEDHLMPKNQLYLLVCPNPFIFSCFLGIFPSTPFAQRYPSEHLVKAGAGNCYCGMKQQLNHLPGQPIHPLLILSLYNLDLNMQRGTIVLFCNITHRWSPRRYF